MVRSNATKQSPSEESISIIFDGKKESFYDFIMVDKEGKYPYEGRLGRLGDILYLDLVPKIDPIIWSR